VIASLEAVLHLIAGVTWRGVTLERLIQLKRAAGRPKDLEAIAELLTLLDEARKN
jgi:predicted nucleotidyltransferase